MIIIAQLSIDEYLVDMTIVSVVAKHLTLQMIFHKYKWAFFSLVAS